MPGEVVLHIYDVTTTKAISAFNAGLRVVGTGAFHGAVEVYGKEWSYGYCEQGTGVFDCPPKGCTAHIYRESVPMGSTSMSQAEVAALVRQMQVEWPGADYDLLRRNCCSFSDAFCRRLGIGPIPKWVTNLAGAGATLGHHAENVLTTMQAAAIIAAAKANEVDEKYKIKGTVGMKAKEIIARVDTLDKQYKVSEQVTTTATHLTMQADKLDKQYKVTETVVTTAGTLGESARGFFGGLFAGSRASVSGGGAAAAPPTVVMAAPAAAAAPQK
mmetsp:Transcript_96117/g.200786  ORF Transcript_96117/g.200786 Transcript_96117/m.200786 type:complete len:272 (-) Transcript_96117:202-1017(-)